MTGLIFLTAWLAVPVLGFPFCRALPSCFDSRAGRIAFAFGAGSILFTLAMLALTAAGIPWTLLGILVAAAVPAGVFLARTKRGRRGGSARIPREALPGIAAAAVAVIVFGYAAATARATSADLLFFWGTKGQDFASARGIDVAFLAVPDHILLHPDYPPLLPCLYSLGAIAGGRFPWGAALLTSPLFFALTLGAFWGASRRTFGEPAAAVWCAFLGALLGFGFLASEVVGNAEPPLLFFETLAMGFLVFGDRSPKADLAASVALAGCALTKFEGTFFAAAAAGIFAAFRSGVAGRARALLRLAVLPALALSAWLVFCARNGILYNYRPATGGPLTFVNFREVLAGIAQNVSYGAAYIPWIALAIVLAAGGLRRESLAPALLAAAVVASIAFYYLHGRQDPSAWIRWSARRTFLTPMLCLVFAASAPGDIAQHGDAHRSGISSRSPAEPVAK